MDTRRESLRSGFIVSVMLWGLLLAAPSWAELACGDTIGPNKIAYLKHDLTCNAVDTGGVEVPALTVEANSILFLGGHTVTCDGIDIGILMDGAGSRLVYGTVKNCHVAGVEVAGTGGHLIKKVTATGNAVGFAIHGGSHGNSFIYNSATNNGIGFGGGGVVFGIADTNENEFRSNRSTNNREGGYVVIGDRNIFKYNLAKNTIDAGWELRGNDNVVIKNRASANRAGFVMGGDRNTVIANIANGNELGIVMVVGSSGFEVIGNAAKSSTAIGILMMAGAINSRVILNVASGSAEYDLVDENDECDDNTWTNNRFRTSLTVPPDAGCIH